MIITMPEDTRTPYARGEADGFAGKPGPAFPKADAPWQDKLYNRGWQAGVSRRVQAAIRGEPIEVQA